MGKVTAVVMASTLALSIFSHAAEIIVGDYWYLSGGSSQRSVQGRMFDSISLTEHQRQQVQGLVQQVRREQSPAGVSEAETMHHLVTAEESDESAVRIQTERMAQKQVARQIGIARIHNQMYRLLTPEQQAILDKKYEQQIEQLCDITYWKGSSSLNLSSSGNSRSQQ